MVSIESDCIENCVISGRIFLHLLFGISRGCTEILRCMKFWLSTMIQKEKVVLREDCMIWLWISVSTMCWVMMCISPLMARELMSLSLLCLMQYQVPSQCSSTCWCSFLTPRLLSSVLSFILWQIVFTSVWLEAEIYRLWWYDSGGFASWVWFVWLLYDLLPLGLWYSTVPLDCKGQL